MNYLAGNAAFFFEEFTPETSSTFDVELDAAVTADALERGTMQGFCNVAASPATFAVTDPNVRENVIANVSGSANRHRMLVCALSTAVFGHPSADLPTVIRTINDQRKRLFLTETTTPLHHAIASLIDPSLFITSEYFGDEYRSGEFVNGTLHVDLQRTSFPDDHFDLIVTSDVMEHVPDAPLAEREIVRILKPGGCYCFTVPLAPTAPEDMVLAALEKNGNLEYFAEPTYHGDPLRPEGVLVFRIFSIRQMTARFQSLGSTCSTYRLWSKGLGIIGPGCWIHLVTKNERG